MTGRPVIVGLDLGTSNAKALAYDDELRLWGRATQEYPIDSPATGRAEQDADRVVEAALGCLTAARQQAEAAGARVRAVALSAAMHSILAVDTAGRPLTPALTYADARAAAEGDALRHTPVGDRLHARTGTAIHPMSPLLKLRWFAHNEPDTFRRAARWISLKEHLLARLGAPGLVDASIASATGMYDLATGRWDPEALAVAGVEPDRLGEIIDPMTVLRVPALDVPVVVGANDGALANLGAGAVVDGVGALTIGTSGAVRLVTRGVVADPALFCTVLTADRFVVGGATSNGGLVLRWLRNRWLADDHAPMDYEALTDLAADVPAGAEGLLWLPYLSAERAPDWDPTLRGALLGMDLRHGRGHLVRAGLEGVALQLRRIADAVQASGGDLTELRATGGFTHSRLWLQVVADVLGRPLRLPIDPEGSTLGAAMLGMVATGAHATVDDVAAVVQLGAQVEPDEVVHRSVHDPQYAEFRAAAATLREMVRGADR